MFSVQPKPAFIVPVQSQERRVRRAFHPSTDGAYRLPRDVGDLLVPALEPYRNRQKAFRLALHLARNWSVPGRVGGCFPIDRRALAQCAELGLTEDEIRGAIALLERIGFLVRAVSSGSRYRLTEEGFRRKAVLFQFGAEYAPKFLAANRRVAAARERQQGERRAIAPHRSASPSAGLPGRSIKASLKSPINKSEAITSLIMGELRSKPLTSGLPPVAFEPNPKLERALDRLLQGIRRGRGGSETRE